MSTHEFGNEDATVHGSAAQSFSEKEKTAVATTGMHEDEYPHGVRLGLITLALCLSVFLMALDNTIIATAIPTITNHFQSLDDVGWYGSSYLLATAATQLLYGKFYTFLPIKWVYVAAIVVFEIGSALCGAAPSSTALIVGRAIAGLGSAGIFSGAMIIIAHTVPLSKRPMYSGLIGGMYGLASVAGPLMGGAFTDKVSWRWCFYINLPIGAVTLLVIVFLFQMPPSAKHTPTTMSVWDRVQQFDPMGTVVFIPAIVSLLLALQWGGTKYAWGNGRIIGLFVVFGVLIIAFIAIQIWKQDNATVPPRIFKQRSIWASALFAICLGASFFIMVFYIPIWFQAIKGTSAVRSGIDNLPMILALVVGSMLSGALTTTFGYYTPYTIASSILMSIGAGLLSTFQIDTGKGKWIGYQIIFGLGVGLGFQGPLMAAQTVLPLEDVPIGTSIAMFVQTLGGSLFISIGQNVFTNKLLSGIAANVPGVSPEIVLSVGATNLKNFIPPQFYTAVLEVYNHALVSAYYVSIAMGALSIFGALAVEWRSVKGKDIQMGMA